MSPTDRDTVQPNRDLPARFQPQKYPRYFAQIEPRLIARALCLWNDLPFLNRIASKV
jgi:hypothetical protein